MAAVFTFAVAARLAVSYFRHEGGSTERWLFPGLIGIRRGAQGASAGKETICRRGMGTLFYDASWRCLSIPLGDGAYDHCRCEPHDGLIAVWAWLNTAQPPDDIHLDNIA